MERLAGDDEEEKEKQEAEGGLEEEGEEEGVNNVERGNWERKAP